MGGPDKEWVSLVHTSHLLNKIHLQYFNFDRIQKVKLLQKHFESYNMRFKIKQAA